MTGEQVVEVDGVRLCVDTFGDPADPAVLLLAGMGSTMDLCEPGWCVRLAGHGRHVLRYDHRDTGGSSHSPAGHPDYTSVDLAEDAVRVLDALDVRVAHLVGISMGGGLAQVVSASHPDRVETLTLVATTCAGTRASDAELPGSDPGLWADVEAIGPEPDWTDRAAAATYLARELEAYAGPAGRDPDRLRAMAVTMVERTADVAAMRTNHGAAPEGDAPAFAMADLSHPTLVLHGDADRLFPLAHGEALAAEIAGSRLVVLEGAGHEPPPPPLWDMTVREIVTHTALAE